GAGYAVGTPADATVTIDDDEPVVSIEATDPSAREVGPDPATFTLTRSGSTDSALTVSYTVGGTATPASDYQALSGSVTIPAGPATATVPVNPVDDTVVAPPEPVVAPLAAGPGYAVGSPSSATATIADDDINNLGTPVVTIQATDPSASEDGPDAGTFTVTRTGGSALFCLDANGSRAWDTGDVAFAYGTASDMPFAGDWDGDGKAEVGFKRADLF